MVLVIVSNSFWERLLSQLTSIFGKALSSFYIANQISKELFRQVPVAPSALCCAPRRSAAGSLNAASERSCNSCRASRGARRLWSDLVVQKGAVWLNNSCLSNTIHMIFVLFNLEHATVKLALSCFCKTDTLINCF